MEKRRFGRTSLDVSRLTFGCGAVGGLMVAGEAPDQDRAVAWARDNGIYYFDTAASYGNGVSETNLGRALGRNRDGIVIGTKVGIADADHGDIEGAIRTSLEASLKRLQQDHVDLFQLHNVLDEPSGRGYLKLKQVFDEVVPAFEKLREEGKTRFLGFTAKGTTEAIHALVDSDHFDSAQVFYNLLVPSAGEPVPDGYPAQDYGELLNAAEAHGVGTICVRVLAGGALSGSEKRHPLGSQSVTPIGSSDDYAVDVGRALNFEPLIAAGHADTLPELAVRYAVSNPKLSTIEIGIATLEEVQKAAAAVEKGPLSAEALAQIREIQSGFA